MKSISHQQMLNTGEKLPFPGCLPEMIDRIVRGFDPLRIILFGSWARGNPRSDSDVDLLVVLPHIENKRKAAIRIGNELSNLHISKDILVTTPDEIDAKGNVIGLVLRSALKEGKIIYESERSKSLA